MEKATYIINQWTAAMIGLTLKLPLNSHPKLMRYDVKATKQSLWHLRALLKNAQIHHSASWKTPPSTAAVHRQTPVTAYVSSTQLLLFAIAWQSLSTRWFRSHHVFLFLRRDDWLVHCRMRRCIKKKWPHPEKTRHITGINAARDFNSGIRQPAISCRDKRESAHIRGVLVQGY